MLPLAGVDYVVTKKQLTFPPTSGRGTQLFSVVINGDLIPEAAEYFSVEISRVMSTHPQVIIGVPSTGVGEILNDDSEFFDTNTVTFY